jgi:hypothetical protein
MLPTGHHFNSVYVAHALLFKIQYSNSELNHHHKSETAANKNPSIMTSTHMKRE